MSKGIIIPAIVILSLGVIGAYAYQYHSITNSQEEKIKEAESGIDVKAIVSPTCGGPQREGEICFKPYKTSFVVKTKDGIEISRFETDEKGLFRLNLAPGVYTIEPVIVNKLPHASPQTVKIEKGKYLGVTFDFDTGIR